MRSALFVPGFFFTFCGFLGENRFCYKLVSLPGAIKREEEVFAEMRCARARMNNFPIAYVFPSSPSFPAAKEVAELSFPPPPFLGRGGGRGRGGKIGEK